MSIMIELLGNILVFIIAFALIDGGAFLAGAASNRNKLLELFIVSVIVGGIAGIFIFVFTRPEIIMETKQPIWSIIMNAIGGAIIGMLAPEFYKLGESVTRKNKRW